MSILCLQRCCPIGPTFVTVLSMENMATALLHAEQMAIHIDPIEWGKRTRQSQGSYNSLISALCVSISFYEGDSLLTHRLAPGLFCTPTTESILKQLQQPFLWFFEATMTKGHSKGHSGLASKWWGAARSFSWLYVVCVSISSSPLSSLLTHQCMSV
jgi:hypothetical protein